MASDRNEIVQNSKHLKSKYKVLFGEIEQILFRHDPIGIAYVDDELVADNPDEYSPEVGTILPRLDTANSVDDITKIVHEEFMHWFDDAGPKSTYGTLSVEIWEAWNRFKGTQE